MNIREFSLNLQKLYEETSQAFSSYQSATGLHCPPSCGRCCQTPDIEASELEMIPMALKIYEQGESENWLNQLENSKRKSCLVLEEHQTQGQGQCRFYHERPLVCRMFGVAGRYDKNHKVSLAICKHLKEIYPSPPAQTQDVPIISDWSGKLCTLHPELSQKKIPINAALKQALERISFYMQYQN